jgi:hypothetical protein
MDVIIHEAVGIDFTVTLSTVSCKGIEEPFIIIIRGEDVLLVDASGYDVVNSGTAFYTGYSWHQHFSFNLD